MLEGGRTERLLSQQRLKRILEVARRQAPQAQHRNHFIDPRLEQPPVGFSYVQLPEHFSMFKNTTQAKTDHPSTKCAGAEYLNVFLCSSSCAWSSV